MDDILFLLAVGFIAAGVSLLTGEWAWALVVVGVGVLVDQYDSRGDGS